MLTKFKAYPLSISLFFMLFLGVQNLIAQSDTLYIVDKMAQFPGGDKAFSEYWTRAYKVPFKFFMNPIEGEGKVHFMIDASGNISQIYIKQSLNPELDAAAVKAVASMPRWVPSQREGENVAMGHYVSFWVTNNANQGTRITTKQLDSATYPRGFFFGIWAGFMPHTGDLGSYFSPIRGNLGITFLGYTYKRWQMAFEYDCFSLSAVKKNFQIDGKTATTDMRISPINLYMSIGYAWKTKGDWTLRPYIAPTLNSLYVELDNSVPGSSNSKIETIGNMTTISPSLGLCGDKILSRKTYLKRNGSYRYEVAFIRTRLNINPIHFSKNNSTTMDGTAMSLTVGLFGQFLKGK